MYYKHNKTTTKQQQKQQQNKNKNNNKSNNKNNNKTTVTAYNKGDSGSNYILTINTTTQYISSNKRDSTCGQFESKKTNVVLFFLSNLTQIPS